MPGYLTAVSNGLITHTCDLLILIFLPLANNLCHVLLQPATSNRLVSHRASGNFRSEYRELCSSLFLFFKGKKKEKWLNIIPFNGDLSVLV